MSLESIKNVDTDRVLDLLKQLNREADTKHSQIIAVEEARYKQEKDDLYRFEQLFYNNFYAKKD